MKVCLVIGHKESSSGACNESGLCEFQYNEHIVHRIAAELKENNKISLQIVYRKSYKKLPKKVNSLKPDLVISFHCNAYNTQVSGSEVLYYHASKKSKKHAQAMLSHIADVLKLPERGINPVDEEAKGGYLLKNTNAPCILIEPFFIDNNSDLNRAVAKENELIDAYVDFIKSTFV